VTQQTAETARALWTRLSPYFDDTPRTRHVEAPAGRANWPTHFGGDIPDVRSVVVHCTEGWPSRDKWNEFVDRYTVIPVAPATPLNPADPASVKAWKNYRTKVANRGVGPHFYMAHDGSVFRLLTETSMCWHATFVNGWAIGVETGNLLSGPDGTGPAAGAGGPWPGSWTALTANAADVPGARFYAKSVNGEVLVYAWSNANSPQSDSSSAGPRMMWITEAQYRGWARFARWLAEVWRIPRNFPLRPHLLRAAAWQAPRWRAYREIVNADPMREPLIRTQLQPAPYNCPAAVFDSDDPATGFPHVYAQGVANLPNGQGRNELWTKLFNSFRGFHGHGFSGETSAKDHNCPGAWFDWHRFARDVWDYWWYPFDLARAAPAAPITSGRPRRDYGVSDGYLAEHYFDDDAALYAGVTPAGFYPVGEETVTPHLVLEFGSSPATGMIRMFRRYWGFWHGGMHFHLDSGSPIYALAAGKLVAARLHAPGVGGQDPFDRHNAASAHPSAHFVLLRHEVFFRRRGATSRIDYDQEPTHVYSLYMHLGTPSGLSYTDIVDANPTWLNRVIAVKKEYDAGLAFRTAHPNPAAQWTPHATRWTRQQGAIDNALTELQAGRIAIFPQNEDAIAVSLGDAVGIAGHLNTNAFGLHLEVFSRDQLSDPWFDAVDQSASARRPYHDEQNLDDVTAFLAARVPVPANGSVAAVYRPIPAVLKATRFQKVALRSKSEWALTAADFPAGGWAAAEKLMWYPIVNPALTTLLATSEPAASLPSDSVVWHYHPLGFMSWLNDITWRSEWPKFQVKDASGADVPAPPRPPRWR